MLMQCMSEVLVKHSFAEKNYSSDIFQSKKCIINSATGFKYHFFNSGVEKTLRHNALNLSMYKKSCNL